MDSNESLCLKWNNYTKTYSEKLNDLRLQNVLTDVTIACEDKNYAVHKLVLVACSDWFCKVLSNLPCNHPIIYLRGVNSKEIDILIEFMYTGEIEILQCDVHSLLAIAESLQIKGLGIHADAMGYKFGHKPPDDKITDIPFISKPSQDNGSTSNQFMNEPSLEGENAGNISKNIPSNKSESIITTVSSPNKSMKGNTNNSTDRLVRLDTVNNDFNSSESTCKSNVQSVSAYNSMIKKGHFKTMPNIKEENYLSNTISYDSHSHLNFNMPSTSSYSNNDNILTNRTLNHINNVKDILPRDTLSDINKAKTVPDGDNVLVESSNFRQQPNLATNNKSDVTAILNEILQEPKLVFEFPIMAENQIKTEVPDEDPEPRSKMMKSSLPSEIIYLKEKEGRGTSNNSIEEGTKMYLEAFTRSANLARSHSLDENMDICNNDADRPFSCPICKKNFAKAAILKRHHLAHFRPYVCHLCSRSFTRREVLAEHLSEHEGADLRMPCPVCNVTIKRKRNLQAHIKVKHPEYYRHKIASHEAIC